MVKVSVRSPHTLLGESLECSLATLGVAVVDDSVEDAVALVDLTAEDLPLPTAPHPKAVAMVCQIDASTVRSAKHSGYRGIHALDEGRDVLVSTLRAVSAGHDAIDDWAPPVVVPPGTLTVKPSSVTRAASASRARACRASIHTRAMGRS
jgi:hypothetical protein